jgi:rod shape-determining protein MreC
VTNRQKRYLLFLYLFIGLALFIGSTEERVNRSQFLGRTVFYPFTFTADHFRTKRSILEENQAQQTQIADLIIRYTEQQTKLDLIYSSHLNFPTADTTFILADVVGFSGNFLGRTLVVSKGLMHGVRANNPVFSSDGVVGKVLTANQNFSIILPLNHPTLRLAVVNQPGGVQGILVSDIYANIAMSYLQFGANVTVGDTVVTSNLSQIFPPNFPVGRIVRIEESADAIYLRAVLEPFSDISNLQRVFILQRERPNFIDIDIAEGFR